jgi:cytochrome b6-f complex iron-sulfur subunit
LVVAIVIILVLVGAATLVLLLANRARSSTGGLSRETRRRDQDTAGDAGPVSTSTEIEAAGRERADETRSTLGGGLVRRRRGEVVEYEPVDEEELGVTRRQFFNRGLLIAVGFGLAGFAPAMLAFLWPFASTGFGGVFTIGNVDDIKAKIASGNQPFYAPQARAYMSPYPNNNKGALAAAKKVYKPSTYQGMEQYGLVALYQRCVHLGCRVPFCQSSQWFECPCHGSKYNRVGEKKAGPAPRGLDRFNYTVDGGVLKVDTGTIVLGPPIGTNTTGQEPEGPLCV